MGGGTETRPAGSAADRPGNVGIGGGAMKATRQEVSCAESWCKLCCRCPLLRCTEERPDQPTPCPIRIAESAGLSPEVAVTALNLADDDLWVYEELCARLSAQIDRRPARVDVRVVAEVGSQARKFRPADVARQAGIPYQRAYYLVAAAAAAGLVQRVGGMYRMAC